MKTFIKVLTTDSNDKEFSYDSYGSFSLEEKIIHMVRQCVGIKYLKLAYGSDLWFLFDKYQQDMKRELGILSNNLNLSHVMRNKDLSAFLSSAITICNNALYEDVTRVPVGIKVESDFDKYYMPINSVPEFGSIDFVKTFYCHLINIHNGNNKKTFDGKAAILIPYNAMSMVSSWKEVSGQNYEYDFKKVQEHANKIGIDVNIIPPFFTLLTSINNAFYLQSINGVLGLLASFMIDPKYIHDYCGYITAFNNRANKSTVIDKKSDNRIFTDSEINTIIYKGCYRILFDEVEHSIFNNINNQCQCVLNVNQRTGLVKPIVSISVSKTLFWLLSYINNLTSDFFNDNKILTKFITYFESKINPNDITQLLEVLYKMPKITVEEYQFLMASSLSSLFSNKLSPFRTEEDQEEEGDDTEDNEEENTDDSTDTGEDDTAGEDDEADNEEKKEELEDPEPADEEEIEDSDPPAENENEIGDGDIVPKYLLKLSSPPNLNNALYRLELDRVIGLVLTNPPKSMSNETIKLLTNLRAHWIHLISLPILKLIINKINATGSKP